MIGNKLLKYACIAASGIALAYKVGQVEKKLINQIQSEIDGIPNIISATELNEDETIKDQPKLKNSKDAQKEKEKECISKPCENPSNEFGYYQEYYEEFDGEYVFIHANMVRF